MLAVEDRGHPPLPGAAGAAARARCGRPSRCARCRPSAPSSRRRTRHGTRPGRRPRPTESKACDCRATRRASGSPAPAGRPSCSTPSRARRSPRRPARDSTSRACSSTAARVGGPALRAMTFHQRARMLKALAQHLMERKDEFYQVSAATGATKADSWIDIEGGIGTFFAYASQGRREFPDETFYVDGRSSGSRRAARFVGRHICVPLEGVAVHINAFNFPVLGDAGEARADVPRRHAGDRQAGDRDVVPHRGGGAQRWSSRGSCRRARSSSSAAARATCSTTSTCQDVVAFTGSAATGRKLKSHPRDHRAHRSASTMEADSLNFSHARPRCRAGHARSSISSSRKSRRR